MNNIDYNKIYLNNIIKVKLNWIKFISSNKEKINIFDISLKFKEIENELLNEFVAIEDIDNAIILKLIEKGLLFGKKYYPINNYSLDNIILAKYFRDIMFQLRDLTNIEEIITSLNNGLYKQVETNITYHGLEKIMNIFTDEISIGYNQNAVIAEQVYLDLSILSYIIYSLKNNYLNVDELELLINSIMVDYQSNFHIDNVNNVILLCELLNDKLVLLNKSKRLELK